MFDSFLLNALIAACLISCATAPLGCFVLWRRMVFFGDATAHAALLGVVFALVLNLSVLWGLIAIAFAITAFVLLFENHSSSSDSLLGVFSHSALALGLFLASILGMRVNLEALLFGDILTVNAREIILIGLGCIGVLGMLYWRWNGLLLSTLDPELATAEGKSPRFEQACFMITLALVIALSIKVIGALLITALLIIPAAAARSVSFTPIGMILAACGISVAASAGGVGLSFTLDTPTGPTIICCAAVFFVLTRMFKP